MPKKPGKGKPMGQSKDKTPKKDQPAERKKRYLRAKRKRDSIKKMGSSGKKTPMIYGGGGGGGKPPMTKALVPVSNRALVKSPGRAVVPAGPVKTGARPPYYGIPPASSPNQLPKGAGKMGRWGRLAPLAILGTGIAYAVKSWMDRGKQGPTAPTGGITYKGKPYTPGKVYGPPLPPAGGMAKITKMSDTNKKPMIPKAPMAPAMAGPVAPAKPMAKPVSKPMMPKKKKRKRRPMAARRRGGAGTSVNWKTVGIAAGAGLAGAFLGSRMGGGNRASASINYRRY